MTVRTLATLDMALGECPRWHEPEQAWYWVDITGQTLYRYQASGQLDARRFPFQPACFAFATDNSMILSSSAGLYRLTDFDAETEFLIDPEAGQTGQRFNDGTVLPNGDLVIGSIGDGEQPTGVRYRFHWRPEGMSSQVIETGYTIINAQCCSPDGSWCYVTDTPTQRIHRQAILDSGELGPKEVFYTCAEDEFPDGAATDIEGNLWVAMYGSAQIVVISPMGQKLQSIPLPAQQPTMVAFGGEDLKTLVITTARQGMPDDAPAENGSVLTLQTNVRGSVVIRCVVDSGTA
ncbi:SMP-30/gluconolactonase/LRE family protein [Reinekea blandensis]|uniref:SMP-30/Gluconolactonase/LRE-like region domain-containing protein n=1 Tax=Reinekea blandensis MED297 TaxID=314283 RepID=A4BET7_9GAMM|nr:SMP-30/gluconolactonase/LRE family protein [Reinekea blandensis]EAR09272.1 hypothetical protein MED297_18328 [Reinekea sp. MED297] [Reinekea blandensis MED297]